MGGGPGGRQAENPGHAVPHSMAKLTRVHALFEPTGYRYGASVSTTASDEALDWLEDDFVAYFADPAHPLPSLTATERDRNDIMGNSIQQRMMGLSYEDLHRLYFSLDAWVSSVPKQALWNNNVLGIISIHFQLIVIDLLEGLWRRGDRALQSAASSWTEEQTGRLGRRFGTPGHQGHWGRRVGRGSRRGGAGVGKQELQGSSEALT